MKKRSTSIHWGLIQTSLTDKPQMNLKKTLRYLQKIQESKPDAVVLPEMYLGSPSSPEERVQWIEIYQEGHQALAQWCQQNKTYVFYTGLEKDKRHFYNTATMINPKGEVQITYRKIHLFRLDGEHRTYSAGNQLTILSCPLGKLGWATCFDLRFPEMIRALTIQGIQTLIVSAQWPESRRDHWLTLLRARAIENQIFIVAVNRLGKKNQHCYSGDSVILNPWGDAIVHMKKSKVMDSGIIDLQEINLIRTQYPFLKERKPFTLNKNDR